MRFHVIHFRSILDCHDNSDLSLLVKPQLASRAKDSRRLMHCRIFPKLTPENRPLGCRTSTWAGLGSEGDGFSADN